MYRDDIATIEAALTLFHDDDRGCHLQTNLFDFGIEMRIDGKFSDRAISNITYDLWNISTLLARLDWMRQLAVERQLDAGSWRSFSSLDVENLFVQVRSSMDHAAELLQAHLPKGGQLPESFNKLHGSIEKYRARLPIEFQRLIESAKWFDQMRGIRDALVHQGGMPLIFGEPGETLLFQVYGKGMSGYASHPALMFNENVVHFERYAALLVANLLVFLDSLGRLLQTIRQGAMKIGPVRSYSSGLVLLRGWLVQTRESLKRRSSA